jgi:glycosyltransferase involved in cell wall biosynthesis
MYSVITPVYRNEEFVPHLIDAFAGVARTISDRFGLETEFVFVVDASPDNSHTLLAASLPEAGFRSQLVLHARNFGSFAAIRTGLQAAKGDYFGIIAADLQEPPELLVGFLDQLITGESDIVIGVREGRDDPASSRFAANLFWNLYRRFVIRDIPEGGVDVFGCNRRIRDELLKLEEANSSLVGLVFWLGFRRAVIPYTRRARAYGKSAWTLSRKITYLLDSVFAFTDLPIRVLTWMGVVGVAIAVAFGLVVVILRIANIIHEPGYAATILAITFFGALNTLGLGLVGAYAWRAYENTKRRPLALVRSFAEFAGIPGRPEERGEPIQKHRNDIRA